MHQPHQLDSFKVRAEIYQYYISRVAADQIGVFDFGNQTYRLEISKIFPEVTSDRFQGDMESIGDRAVGSKGG